MKQKLSIKKSVILNIASSWLVSSLSAAWMFARWTSNVREVQIYQQQNMESLCWQAVVALGTIKEGRNSILAAVLFFPFNLTVYVVFNG